MAVNTVVGAYENGVVVPKKKMKLADKTEVIIMYSESGETSIIKELKKKLKPVNEKLIDETIEL